MDSEQLDFRIFKQQDTGKNESAAWHLTDRIFYRSMRYERRSSLLLGSRFQTPVHNFSPRSFGMKFTSFLVCSLLLVSLQNASRAAVVFTDDFSSDPATNGWTELSSAADTATGLIESDGSSAVLRKTGGSSRITLTISRTISSVGFEDILVDFTAFQSLTGYENDDFIRIEYNSGSGFVTLLQDNEVWTGVNNISGDGTSGNDGNVTPTSISTIALGADANENVSLQFRLTADLNATTEDVFFR